MQKCFSAKVGDSWTVMTVLLPSSESPVHVPAARFAGSGMASSTGGSRVPSAGIDAGMTVACADCVLTEFSSRVHSGEWRFAACIPNGEGVSLNGTLVCIPNRHEQSGDQNDN
jgi:hypothetical protein